ncbi:dipeptidase [Dyadobacter tibetensis]|uniref:dipeptidase n=1 Tax=Dyadobacter tibetensis TaxID=1211851 RepID=UPI00046FEE96|nr:dipeptidase [Dyadobacter tibetensis]
MKQYIEKNKERFLNELLELLRIPSVSADSKFKEDMKAAAAFVQKSMLDAGADRAEIFETPGHPIVYGEKMVDPSLPTVLVYGHYDVQPADPYELWNSPPFEPVIKNDRIYARGACDDKGQFYMHIKALETMIANDTLACNIKMMIEGEEEVGSSHLETFVTANKDLLACDTILISDTSIIANDVPSIETGLRGLTYVEVEVVGPNRDLHSGVYGGGVANPINVLCDMISSLTDSDGRITVPGFYDQVVDLSVEERAALNAAPFDLEAYKKDLDVGDVAGEKGYSTIERTSVRPTLDVNGIWGGYIGEGAKTVLPSKANAKISMRLVPNQTDEEICALFTKHFESLAPASVKVEVRPHHGGLPYVTPTDSVEYQAAEMAMEESFGKKPIPTRGGGSIPIVALFERELGQKSILMGFGLDIDALHSPNESYGLFNYYKGIETIPLFFKYYAQLKK